MKLVIEVSEKIYDTIMADVMPTREQMSVIVTRIYQGIPYEERTHGSWEGKPERKPLIIRKCTSCGELSAVGNFCMWCCADMMKEGDEK